jgi:hypothetical protein
MHGHMTGGWFGSVSEWIDGRWKDGWMDKWAICWMVI